jgi:DNA-binding NarL/FixJ family response regulator
MQELAIAEAHERVVDLAVLWEQLAGGQAVLSNTYSAGGRAYAEVARLSWQRMGRIADADILVRYFRGVSQKVLAYDSQVSAATICSRCTVALTAMAPAQVVSRASIVLVAAAHASQGIPVEAARVERIEQHMGGQRMLISYRIPGDSLVARLSPSERDVALLLIEGRKHEEIALARETSVRTTANQLASIFQKIGVSGRAELRCKAILETAERHLTRHTKPFLSKAIDPRSPNQPVLRLL